MKVTENKTEDYLTSNFTENEVAWTSDSIYNYEDEVRDGHYIYKYAGVSGTNTTATPSIDSVEYGATWVQINPSNYYAMLDGKTSTQTSVSGNIEITVSNTNYDTLALIGLEALTADIELYDNVSASVVYTKSIDLQDETEIVDFTTYCFSLFDFKPSVFIGDMPLYTDAELSITMTPIDTHTKCGRLVLGRSFYVGDTDANATLSLESYSRKETDVFGNTSLTQLNSVNLDTYKVYVPRPKIPMLKRTAQELDAIPLLFVMDESADSDLENLLNYGYWYDFSMIISDKDVSTISLTVKGIL